MSKLLVKDTILGEMKDLPRINSSAQFIRIFVP